MFGYNVKYDFNLNHKTSDFLIKILPRSFFNSIPLNVVSYFRLDYSKSDFSFLRKSQWLSKKDLRKFQTDKLREIVNFSYRNVPYYRRLFKKIKITPEDIRTLEDLRKIPVIDKKTVIRNYSDFISPNCSYFRIFSTSGSVGKPFLIPADKNCVMFRESLIQRNLEWSGFNPGRDKIMGIMRPPSYSGSGVQMSTFVFLNLRFLLSRQLYLAPRALDDKEVLRILNAMKKFEPRLIYTIPNVMRNLKRVQDDFGFDFPSSVKTVSVGSSTVGKKEFDYLKDIEVFARYGASDIACMIANECSQHDGLHINMEGHILELLRKGEKVSDGQEGEVVISDLWNYDVPLIRYRMEDVADFRQGNCECGRESERLGKIYGRKTDLLITEDGKMATQVEWPLQSIREIDQFRIIQERIDKVTVVIVPAENYSENTERKVISILRKHLGKEVEVRIRIVKKIPNKEKFRFIISKVSSKYF